MILEIKVCGITNKEEMKAIEKLGVDHIGFINIERSKRNISLNDLISYNEKLNDKRLATLVLEPKNAYEVIVKSDRSKIFNVQLHSLKPFDVQYLKWLNQYHNHENINITKAIGLTDKIDDEKVKELENYSLNSYNILLDYDKNGKTGGNNTQIPIDIAIKARNIIKKQDSRTKVTLAGGLNLEYLESIQDKLHYFDMIDLNSGVEDKPGRKNLEKIKEIVKLVKEVNEGV